MGKISEIKSLVFKSVTRIPYDSETIACQYAIFLYEIGGPLIKDFDLFL